MLHGKDGAAGQAARQNVSSRVNARDYETLEDLATELYGVVHTALEKFGVSKKTRDRAISRSLKAPRVPRVSGLVLRDLNFLGELTLAWKTESPYTDEEGFPRVLDLHGTQASFESLARRFFPKKSLPFVVDLACKHADVTAMRSGRIALLGSSVVNTNVANSTPHALAQLVRQIDQLLLTSTYNYHVARSGKGTRRFERMCHAIISRTRFDGLMQELRPQMNDLLERVDSLFRQDAVENSSRNGRCVANVGIYVSRCDEIERAGYHARRIANRARGRPRKATGDKAKV